MEEAEEITCSFCFQVLAEWWIEPGDLFFRCVVSCFLVVLSWNFDSWLYPGFLVLFYQIHGDSLKTFSSDDKLFKRTSVESSCCGMTDSGWVDSKCMYEFIYICVYHF